VPEIHHPTLWFIPAQLEIHILFDFQVLELFVMQDKVKFGLYSNGEIIKSRLVLFIDSFYHTACNVEVSQYKGR